MIPKLFSAAETAFTTEGLGRLSDAISCVVTEERNGKYELEMDYPVDGIHFSEIAHSCYIYAKPSDNKGPQPFSVYSISKPIGGRCTIRAEHISYRLINIPVTPCSASNCADALQTLKVNAVETCPFTFWTDKTSSGTFKVTEPASLRSRLAGSEGSVLDSFGGGEYEWDGMTVKLHAQRGANNGVTLRYGKNIIDIKQEENIQNTFTGVMPYWKKENQDGTTSLLMLNERVVYSSNAGNFPFNLTKILNCSEKWENQPTQAQLRTYATNYVQETGVGVPEVSITVKFLPLWQTEEYKNIANLEHVNLCDIVTVKFEKLGISASAKVVRTKYDTLKERYDEIELGDAKRSLSTSIRSDINAARDESSQKIKEAKSFLREEMEDAISQIVQGDDGYIVFNYDGSDRRTQILAMDTMDVQTAQKILMINYQGIGGFTNGISDPSGYKLAITTDGNIVAESIAAGTIKSALLMGAVLKVGGSTTNGTGSIQIYDDDGNNGVGDTLIGRWDRNGLKCYKGEIQGPKITVGGVNNENGSITVVDANGSQIGKWDVSGLNVSVGMISGNAIHGGSLTLGGNNNENGRLYVKAADGTTNVIAMGQGGIQVYKGTIKGPTIEVGGVNNENGSITVKNASGSTIGTWDMDGLDIKSGTIKGSVITLGGNNNENGRLYVKAANGTDNVIAMGQGGIQVYAGTIQGPNIIAGGVNNTNGTITVKDSNNANVVVMNNSGATIKGSITSTKVSGNDTLKVIIDEADITGYENTRLFGRLDLCAQSTDNQPHASLEGTKYLSLEAGTEMTFLTGATSGTGTERMYINSSGVHVNNGANVQKMAIATDFDGSGLPVSWFYLKVVDGIVMDYP